MLILINRNCSGGRGIKKWIRIQDYFKIYNPILLNADDSEIKEKLKAAIHNGETVFIASGGDGTVNHLLNLLIQTATSEELKKFTIGAVGIGSSNDFHKPFNAMIEGIPLSVDFEHATLRDVVIIYYALNDHQLSKYFLINASIGITAEANNFFNKTDRVLNLLKKVNTKSAILYSALKTIFSYKNLIANICINGAGFKTKITNLGITKNSHFSGDFCYDSVACYDNEKFDVHLAYDMRKLEVLRLMKALTTKSFSKLPKTKSWQSDRIIVSSHRKFVVEFDGEVICTNKVEFRILPKFIKVCGNGKII